MKPYQKQLIELALSQNALKFGEFTLKSGRKSPYFFNVGQLNRGDVLKILGECYAQAIQSANIEFDVLFGPAYKGIPLVCATAIAMGDISYCFNRKEAKDHGESGIIVGAPLQGKVLILDDVITAGTAIRESLEIIKQHSAQVTGIVVMLDRQEKGQNDFSAIQEIQSTYAIPVYPIITFHDIMDYVDQNTGFAAFRQPLAHYREQYGVL